MHNNNIRTKLTDISCSHFTNNLISNEIQVLRYIHTQLQAAIMHDIRKVKGPGKKMNLRKLSQRISLKPSFNCNFFLIILMDGGIFLHCSLSSHLSLPASLSQTPQRNNLCLWSHFSVLCLGYYYYH